MPKTAITESDAGKALQQLLTDNGAIDIQALNKLLASKGLKAVAKGLAEAKYSRVEHQREWLTARAPTEDEIELIKSLPETLGSAPTILSQDEARDFSQVEVDMVVGEELTRRQVEDMLKGRYAAIRSTALNLVTFRDEDNDPFATGDLVSPQHGHKLVVSKQERGGEPNFAALEAQVDRKTWLAITDKVETREVNEDKLTKALEKGLITMEDLAACIPEKQVIRVLNVRPLAVGDNIG